MKKKTGKVLWFNKVEGRGFILSENKEKVYVHYSAIQSKDKFKILEKGQEVNFTLFEGIHFLQAEKVKVIKITPNSIRFIKSLSRR